MASSKYAGQQWELPVPIPRKTELTADDLAAAQADYGVLYEKEYGKGSAWVGSPIVFVCLTAPPTESVPCSSATTTTATR